MRAVLAPGSGGDVETWIASPPDAGDAALPTVVDIHGGPLGAWAPAPSIEVMLLVERGFRVLLPNIRGSATYGRAWIRESLGDWGGVDAADVHAAIDHAVGLGLVDPSRLGVLGLSYGGFMVHWLIGTSDRFGAAVSENGVANQVSAWANSDSGVEYNRAASLGDALSAEGVEKLWRQSPLRHVANIRTPLLMLQAGADQRCPPADNEQLFTALRVLGREVEYVLYPDESHVYQATGRPDRRIDRMERMLGWFERHLLGPRPAAHGRAASAEAELRRAGRQLAGRGAVAGERSATERRGSEPRRRRLGEERHEEARVERVAGAGRVGRGHRRRRDVEPERGRVASGEDRRAAGAALARPRAAPSPAARGRHSRRGMPRPRRRSRTAGPAPRRRRGDAPPGGPSRGAAPPTRGRG